MLREAIQEGLEAIKSYPKRVIGAVAILELALAAASSVPSAGSILPLVVAPFLLIGVYTVISRAIDGHLTDKDTYIKKGKEQYTQTLVTNIIISLVQGVVAAVGGIVISLLILTSVSLPENVNTLPEEEVANQIFASVTEAAASPTVILTALVFLLLYFVVAAILQFALAGAILDDKEPIESIKMSYGFLRDEPKRILGYFAFRTALSLTLVTAVGLIPLGFFNGSAVAIAQSPAYLFVNGLFTIPGTVVVITIHVAYYRRLRDFKSSQSAATSSAQ